MSASECMDRFGFQHSLLYRNSYSVEISLWTSLGFSVAALLFLIFSAVCNQKCDGWQTIGGDKDFTQGKKGSCESAMFCCGASSGIGGRPRFSWARRAAFFALAFGALICLEYPCASSLSHLHKKINLHHKSMQNPEKIYQKQKIVQ